MASLTSEWISMGGIYRVFFNIYNLALKSLESINVIYSKRMYHAFECYSKLNLDMTLTLGCTNTRLGGHI